MHGYTYNIDYSIPKKPVNFWLTKMASLTSWEGGQQEDARRKTKKREKKVVKNEKSRGRE